MVEHLYADFLKDERVYHDVERYWFDLWNQIDTGTRQSQGWQHPWFQPLLPSISEGNPIFSAVSHRLRRGIRVIQSEPTEKGLEFLAYLDTFGGSVFDPQAIHELVISCALSDVAARVACSLIVPWADGKGFSFDLSDAGLISTNGSLPDRVYAPGLLTSPRTILSKGFMSMDLDCELSLPAA